MIEINILSVYVTILSLTILIIINTFVNSSAIKLLINILFISESFVLTFFFDKYNDFLGFSIILLSLYYFIKTPKSSINFGDGTKSSFPDNLVKYFLSFGIFGIFSVIIYEYFAQTGDISGNNVLVLLLSFLFIFYHRVPNIYSMERDLITLFMFLLIFFLVVPSISYKIMYGYVGQDSGDNWIDREFFVFNLLGKPVANFLSLLGYNVFASGSSVYFENLEVGVMQQVSVAKACSGITSVIVFVSLFVSYLWVTNIRFDYKVWVLLFIGLALSYIANILRMAMIILAGHYWGMEALEFVHSYLGWLLFTGWMFLFWLIFEYTIKTEL